MQGFILSVGELLADVITNEYCDKLEQAKTFQMVAGEVLLIWLQISNTWVAMHGWLVVWETMVLAGFY